MMSRPWLNEVMDMSPTMTFDLRFLLDSSELALANDRGVSMRIRRTAAS